MLLQKGFQFNVKCMHNFTNKLATSCPSGKLYKGVSNLESPEVHPDFFANKYFILLEQIDSFSGFLLMYK